MSNQELLNTFYIWVSKTKGASTTLELGYVVKCDASRERPYTMLWTEYDLDEKEAEYFARFMDLDPTLSQAQLEELRPYDFKTIRVSQEDEASLNEYEKLELPSTAYRVLNFLPAWEEDLDRLLDSIDLEERAKEAIDESLMRPHWVQVEAEAALKGASSQKKEAESMFIDYWKNKVPYEKDEVYELLKKEGLIRHPDTIKY